MLKMCTQSTVRAFSLCIFKKSVRVVNNARLKTLGSWRGDVASLSYLCCINASTSLLKKIRKLGSPTAPRNSENLGTVNANNMDVFFFFF